MDTVCARCCPDFDLCAAEAVPIYAWQANPAAILFNEAGLPATPYRTDDWPGVTRGHAVY